MARFHIVHLVPSERHHGLYGYNEVIETVTWGLKANGHDVSYAVNSFALDAMNIIFGAQLCDVKAISVLPKNSIIYNLEQRLWMLAEANSLSEDAISRDPAHQAHLYQAKNYQIFDYSVDNLKYWDTLDPLYPVRIVPIGYAPSLSRIGSPAQQDIDVLFYGMPNETRHKIISDLCAVGLKVVFLCGLYGRARDDLIARSKVVLNITQYDSIFAIVRVSFLLANKKAIVSDTCEDRFVESDMLEAVKFASRDDFVQAVWDVVHNHGLRRHLEETGFRIMKARDIRPIMQSAVDGLALAQGAPNV